MLNTLRNRLLASYVAILLIMLVLIGFVLLVFLATRPLPVDNIVSDLTGILLDVRLGEALRVDVTLTPPGGIVTRPQETTLEERITIFLNDEAAQRGVRALIVTNDGHVLYDSAGVLAPGTLLTETHRQPLVAARFRPVTPLIEGRFLDPDHKEWVFVAQSIRPLNDRRPESPFVAVAQPVPRPSLRQVFAFFGQTFFVPLVEAGLIGLALAAGLAVLIAGSVARPLGRMSRAARRIAGGDYRQRVAVEGPKEVRALAVSFNEMAGQVAAAQQAQRDFLANVSHDLRTPLTSIQGFSQAIAEGVASDPASAQRAAQIIQDETARLHRMVESLLDLARIEAGRLDMTQRAVALSDLLRGVGDSLSPKARDKGVALDLDIPPHLPRLAGDGDRLAQVFTNLIDNAIKHTPEGGRIVLRAEGEANGIAITIQDTGEGIPAPDLPRIFERFYQVDKSRQNDRRSGMGLGLAITRQIVEAHGGTIRVASKVGEGAIFTVWLPLPSPEMTTAVGRR